MTDLEYVAMRLHEGDGAPRPRRWWRFFFALTGQRLDAEIAPQPRGQTGTQGSRSSRAGHDIS